MSGYIQRCPKVTEHISHTWYQSYGDDDLVNECPGVPIDYSKGADRG
jgi:hypothetical protein